MAEIFDIEWKKVEQIIHIALAEDAVLDDVTTNALIPANQEGKAQLTSKREGVLAGMGVATLMFHKVDTSLKVEQLIAEGSRVQYGDRVATIEGKIASILRAERVALNFLQHLSGIATETARYVEAVSGTRAQITDTRKTTPGLRLLEKYAVRLGGGRNHRYNLADAILIKDNHLKALQSQGMSLEEIIKKARQHSAPALKVEVEVETVEVAQEALSSGADIIMLDNMNLAAMRQVVQLVQGQALLEASGGITLDNVRLVAQTGVDLISVGALTHSAKALDISLDLEP